MERDMRADLTEGESLVWLMAHHLIGAIILMRTVRKQQLVSDEYLEDVIKDYLNASDDVWEEELWKHLMRAFEENPVLATVYTREPDTWKKGK